MPNSKIHTVEGFKDLLFKEVKQKRTIEKKLRKLFQDNGFLEIETPTLEYLETFSTKNGAFPSDKMFKFQNAQGKTVVLRPDITIPIARLTATKFKNEKSLLKYSYIGQVFRYNDFGGGKFSEFTQAGIELVGSDSLEEDTKVLELAIKALKETGLKDFQIYLSNASIKSLNLTGGFEILPEALKMAKNKKEKLAIERIKKRAEILRKKKLDKYISIDFNLKKDFDYDSGIIFKAFAKGIPYPVLSGARYNKLIEDFGISKPAIGFSISISLILSEILGTKKVSKKDNYLKIALAKGRLAEKAIILFKKIGFDFSAHEKDSRKLIFEDKKNKLQFFFVKPVDVPTYVEYGASDIGITGEDIILEEAKDVYEVLDLKYAKCKIVIAGNEKLRGKLNAIHNKRIATKYPHITQEYFSNKYKESVEIIKLSGSVELGPLVSLSEIIVDLVESGGTLKENGLVVLDEIANSSARIIVNRASRMLMKERIDSIVKDLKRVI